ncbi:MAG: helix-turn-helix transcriptional regulator [Myxococcota bacterium]
MDRVFEALADPQRRQALEILSAEGPMSIDALVARMDTPSLLIAARQVHQLEQVGLVVAQVQRGRRRLHLGVELIRATVGHWCGQILSKSPSHSSDA